MGCPKKNARRRAGYTLIELMMIVTIIGISVTAFAPGFGRAMADRRVSNAAREVIRIGRRARSDTFGYLRAHLLWIQPATGRIQLLRGPTNSCLLTPWAAVQADCPAAPGGARGARCLEDLSLDSIGVVAMREESVGGASYGSLNRALCYAPSGVLYWTQQNTITTVQGSVLSVDNTVNGGFVYALYVGSGAPTVDLRMHRVLFPLGGTPRGLR